jgi:hypothetical protein
LAVTRHDGPSSVRCVAAAGAYLAALWSVVLSRRRQNARVQRRQQLATRPGAPARARAPQHVL